MNEALKLFAWALSITINANVLLCRLHQKDTKK